MTNETGQKCNHEVDSDTLIVEDSGPNGVIVTIRCEKCGAFAGGSINDWEWNEDDEKCSAEPPKHAGVTHACIMCMELICDSCTYVHRKMHDAQAKVV